MTLVGHGVSASYCAFCAIGKVDRHVAMLDGIIERKLVDLMGTMLLSPRVWDHQDNLRPSAIVGWRNGGDGPSHWFFDGSGAGLVDALRGINH